MDYSSTIRKRITLVHRDTGFAAHQHSGKAPPNIPNPSDSSIALSTKDSFRPETHAKSRFYWHLLCYVQQTEQHKIWIRYRDGLRSSSCLRWISATSMMGGYVKITRHYSHNRFHPCHPTPGNMCHWRRRLASPVPAQVYSDNRPF